MQKVKELARKISENRLKFGLGLAAVLLLGLIVWTVYTVPPVPEKLPSPNKLMKYSGNTITEEKDGKLIWELTADDMEIDVETQDVVMKDVKGKFYQEDGTVFDVTAESGTYIAKSKNMTLEPKVVITSDKDDRLSCDKLTWDYKKSVLTATGNAKFQHEDLEASGDKIQSSNGFNDFKVEGHAHIVKGKAKK